VGRALPVSCIFFIRQASFFLFDAADMILGVFSFGAVGGLEDPSFPSCSHPTVFSRIAFSELSFFLLPLLLVPSLRFYGHQGPPWRPHHSSPCFW